MKFKTPDALKKIMDKYLDETPEKEWTWTGLALAIGGSRQLLSDYEKREGYGKIIRTAKAHIENSYEEDLKESGRAGTIFALKNFGWKDKQEIIATHRLEDLTDAELDAQIAKQEKALGIKKDE